MNFRALLAEFVGTFMLMSSIFGSAFYSFGAPAGAAGIIGVAFAIGITVMALASSIGHVSGGHYNPAVTIGLVVGGRFDAASVPGYVIAQCLGALASGFVFSQIAPAPASFAANGFGDLSMMKVGLTGVLLIEIVMTAFFLIVILGSTRKSAPQGFAPISIGLALAAIHIMSIPVSNTSVNPARSLAPAVFAGGEALSQVWVFWAAPIAGAIIGAIIYRMVDE